MKTIPFILRLASIGLLLVAGAVQAKDKHAKDQPGKHSTDTPSAESPAKGKEPWLKVEAVITPHEREVIQGYVTEKTRNKMFWKRSKSLPPGLSKKVERGGELPPGWQKKLVRGETMPPEIHGKCQPLPPDLVAKLPPPPPDTVLVAVSGKVVRLLNATREILDVFEVKY
jgi:hypothetical protein